MSALEGSGLTGVFAVDKPEGFTSFDVVAKLRGILKTKKIGHGGTLDPMATGVLPIFVGKATRAADLIADKTKRYIATARFGIKTETGDITGAVLSEGEALPDEEELRAALTRFLGKSSQIPPMYSAVKANGKRLYELARRGETAERTPREIEIFSMTLLEYDREKREFTIDVRCSAGSYIRTLVEDIAAETGALSTLTALRRTASGPFLEGECFDLTAIQERTARGVFDFLQPVDSLFLGFRRVLLNEEQERAFLSGVRIPIELLTDEEETLRVYGCGGFIALAGNDSGRLRAIARFV